MRVALLPTGKAELLGFPGAFNRLFPAHEFHTIAKIDDQKHPFDSFTSSPLPIQATSVPASLDKIIQKAASELVPGRTAAGPPIDLLIITEDLELANRHQPQTVVDAVRQAACNHIAGLNQRLADQVREAFRERASFHLLVPMLESWFFADPVGAFSLAGVPADRLPPRLVPDCDPEAFETGDPQFAKDTGDHCLAWRALPANKRNDKKIKPGWLKRGPQRVYHPKDYLSWLCRSGAKKNCTRYRETHEGKDALEGLNWHRALSTPVHCQYMRSLLADIEWTLNTGLNVQNGACAPLTDFSRRPVNHIFRNI
jgi:hypothetical protein